MSRVAEVQTAIGRLFSQTRLNAPEGIQVRLSAENQVFLNTRRPTRVAIPASLLERIVPGFERGHPSVLRVSYVEKNVSAYHGYAGGEVWVPTAPKGVCEPDEVMTIKVEGARLSDFLEDFPILKTANEALLPWLADFVMVKILQGGNRITLHVDQDQSCESGNHFELDGRLKGALNSKAGMIYADFSIVDAFGLRNEFRLFRRSRGSYGLGVKKGRAFVPIIHLSSDGVRLRLAYAYSKGTSITVFYLMKPSSLYSVGDLSHSPESYRPSGLSSLYSVGSVAPLRDFEKLIVRYGNNYELGRIGAEIAAAIVGAKFGHADLVVAEPAKGGKDLYSKSGEAAVQARFLAYLPRSMRKLIIRSELGQMIRKLKVDFRHTPGLKVGYAVLSYLEGERIKSLVAELLS